MKKILSILFIAMFWLACKKAELPPDSTGDPVFAMQFTAGSSVQSLKAGINDYYQFTRFATDSSGVVVCSGSLAPATCPSGDCAGSLTIEFKNQYPGTQVLPDSLFHQGEHVYVGTGTTTTIIGYRAFFKANDTLNYNSFSWKFNSTSLPSNNTDTISYDFTNNGIQQVELTASGLQTSVIGRPISAMGLTDTLLSVDVEMTHDSIGYTLNALASGMGPFEYAWSTGDTGQQIVGTFSFPDSFGVTVTNNSQQSAFARLKDLSTTFGVYKTANFDYTVQPITVTDSFALGTIAIQWVDAQGIVWRSDRNDQLQDASFTVLESTDYDLNENGQKTRKMRVAFVCRLFNDNGGAMNFSGEGVIGVAYP